MPEDDPAVISLKTALAKRAEMGIVGFTYQQERSFDVLQTAAGNEGTAGGVMGAGLGLGMGVGIGAPLGQTLGQMTTPNNAPLMNVNSSGAPSPSPHVSQAQKFQMLKDLAELKNQGILTEEEFALEKQKILTS